MPRFGKKLNKAKKDKFAELPEEWKDSMAQSQPQALNNELAKIALAEESNREAMKEDADLNNLKEQVKTASAGYREATKANRLKVQFIKRVLEDSGKA